ncbi:hypothetical protein BAE44_0010775, partial [Dichanthelium oligosanthes]
LLGEAVIRIFSSIIRKDEDGSEEGGNIERLEMAHIKMEAAIVTTNKWHIMDVPLLRWRKKLKRAAQECEEMLCEFKHRALEDKETKEKIRQYSFPRRIARANKSFVSSFTDNNNIETSSKAIVHRFERFADGADDFMTYVQLGGTPQKYMSSDALIGHLFAGKFVEYKHCGMEANTITLELTQLPTKDFSWSSQYDSYRSREHWDNVQDTLTQWFRPDPLCCQGYEHNMHACGSGTADASRLSSIFPEPVSEVFLERHISVSEYNMLQGSNTSCNSSYPEDLPTLKLIVLLVPHDCVDDFAIDAEKQQRTHVGVRMHQLDETVLPKAIDHLNSNAGAMIHQISWKSRHGSVHFCVGKTKMKMARTRRATRKGTRNVRAFQTEEQIKKERWKQVARDFMKLLAVRISDRLQGSVTKWLDMYRGGTNRLRSPWNVCI